MAALTTPEAQLGWKATPFALQGVDNTIYTLEKSCGRNGLLIAFICNHCPFVRAILDKIIRDAQELQPYGMNTLAIMPNDTLQYPDDSFVAMQQLSRERHFPFPYVIDETQEVARAYGAVCTPDFFGFNADLELQYRGRLDASRMQDIPDAKRELFEAMVSIATTGTGPTTQHPSMGCSIKWKE